MKMNKTIFIITALLVITSLLTTGCAKKSAPETPQQPSQEETERASEDLSELDNLDKELDMGELENIEKDLEGIDW